MNISIGEKKVFGGAAPRQVRLRDYRRPGGVTGGVPMSLAPRLKRPPKSGELQVSMSTRDRERPPNAIARQGTAAQVYRTRGFPFRGMTETATSVQGARVSMPRNDREPPESAEPGGFLFRGMRETA